MCSRPMSLACSPRGKRRTPSSAFRERIRFRLQGEWDDLRPFRPRHYLKVTTCCYGIPSSTKGAMCGRLRVGKKIFTSRHCANDGVPRRLSAMLSSTKSQWLRRGGNRRSILVKLTEFVCRRAVQFPRRTWYRAKPFGWLERTRSPKLNYRFCNDPFNDCVPSIKIGL